MTVAELIAQLGRYDPALRVVVHGYEEGYAEIQLDMVMILPDADPGPYSGPHEWVTYDRDDPRRPAGAIEVLAVEMAG